MSPQPIKHINLANWEIFLVALHRVGGDSEMVDVESAFIEAHKLAPKRFSWRTQQIPEIKKLSKALRDADAKGGSYMTGTGNKRQLTATGLEWIVKQSDHVALLDDQNTHTLNLGSARSSTGHVLLKRVLKSQEFEHWKTDPTTNFELWKLANVFKCSPDSPTEIWNSRLKQTGAAAHVEGRKDVREFTEKLMEVVNEQ